MEIDHLKNKIDPRLYTLVAYLLHFSPARVTNIKIDGEQATLYWNWKGREFILNVDPGRKPFYIGTLEPLVWTKPSTIGRLKFYSTGEVLEFIQKHLQAA